MYQLMRSKDRFSDMNPDHPANLFLTRKATIDVPTKVALQYNHRFPITPDVMAGRHIMKYLQGLNIVLPVKVKNL
jgi:hypothetical protein